MKTPMKMLKFVSPALIASTVLLFSPVVSNVASAAIVAGPFDFETTGQYTGNFLGVSDAGQISQTTGLANNYVQYANVAAQNGAFYYGTSANTSLEPTFSGAFTVQFDVSAVTANSAFGVYLVNPANTGNSLLAYFNLDTSGTSDMIRFFMNGDPANATSTAGTKLTTGITGTGGTLSSGSFTGNSGLNVSNDKDTQTPGTPVFGTMDVTYTPGISPNTTTLSLSLGSLSATAVIPDSEEIINPEIAIRMVDAGNNVPGTAKMDNFEIISAVPEPSTLALFGIGLAVAAAGASRKKLS